VDLNVPAAPARGGRAALPAPPVAVQFGVLCLLWGLAFVVFHLGLQQVPPLTFSAARAVVAGLGMAAYLMLAGQPWPRLWHSHFTAMLLGASNVAAFWALQNLALLRISPGETAILVYLQPLLVAVGARLFLAETLIPRQLLGLGIGFAGVVAVMGGQVATGGSHSWVGYAFAGGAGLAWATGTVIFKRRLPRESVLWTVALQSLYGAVPLVLLAGWLEHPRVILTFTVLWTVAYAGLGAAALAYLLWYSLLHRRAATRVAAFVFLVPLIAVVGDTAILRDRFGVGALLGGTLVIAGIWLVNTPVSRPVAPRSP
jgi:drug/metabolite transporter (DMT)-like permease